MFDPLDHQYPIDDAEYDDILETAWDRCIDTKRLSLLDSVLIAGPLIVMLPMSYGVFWVLSSVGVSLPRFVTGAAVIIPYVFAIAFGYRRKHRREIITELRARGHNVCPKCGYLRTGLEDTAPCPECGVSIEVPRKKRPC